MSKPPISFRENNFDPDDPSANLYRQKFPSDVDTSNFPLKPIYFQNKGKKKCIEIIRPEGIHLLQTSYYIGLDWINDTKDISVYVEPKLDDATNKTDYTKMLFSCLRHSDVVEHTKDLYEIKFNEPYIEVSQYQDMLTPLLVVQFLQLLKTIVRKGLKKSYYKVERNLNSRIKGKVIISQTIKQNLLKNKPLKTFCQYDEFGFNGIENRLLKQTLLYVKKYLSIFPSHSTFSEYATPIFNYCLPAFHEVDENIEIKSITGIKTNVFYKEYSEAIRLANLILKRFGYNIKNVEGQNNKVKIPPFWIDMSKLFELYVLGKLKDKYKNEILYGKNNNAGSYGWLPDFLMNSKGNEMIIDTKYKTKYKENKPFFPDDIRQLSGYARDKSILENMGLSESDMNRVIDCLIIYPDQAGNETLIDDLKSIPIEGLLNFYKIPIKLPTV
jgi:5-methylcytosine-specific restriction enzyme subunit McrC